MCIRCYRGGFFSVSAIKATEFNRLFLLTSSQYCIKLYIYEHSHFSSHHMGIGLDWCPYHFNHQIWNNKVEPPKSIKHTLHFHGSAGRWWRYLKNDSIHPTFHLDIRMYWQTPQPHQDHVSNAFVRFSSIFSVQIWCQSLQTHFFSIRVLTSNWDKIAIAVHSLYIYGWLLFVMIDL